MEGKYGEAYELYGQAEEVAEKDVKISAWVSASRTYPPAARQLCEPAQSSCDLLHLNTLNEREKGDRGDTARVLDNLSKAIELDCDYEHSFKTR